MPIPTREVRERWNETVHAVQGYFNGTMESEYEYEVQSFLYQIGVPRKDRTLIDYMDRYGLTWDDINPDKVLSIYGSKSNGVQAYTFVSRNLNKLYK